MTQALRRATYEDLLELADHEIGEIIDGELIVSPQPRPRHIRASDRIREDVGRQFDLDDDDAGGPGGWWILTEPEIHLEDEIVVPDLAGWRRERLPELPEDEAFFTLSPDWVCEVLSPSTIRIDRFLKMRVYARHGVGVVWLVDPAAKALEVYQLGGDHHRLVEVLQGEVRARVIPFEAVELNLARWWQTRARLREGG